MTDFAAGLVPVIINCGVLTEGTDLPRTDCILLARPTCNSSLYIQMVGRGLRTHQDKGFCLVLDVIDKLKSPKRSLITFPSLIAAREGKKTTIPIPIENKLIEKSKDQEIQEIHFGSIQIRINKFNYSTISLENERLAWVKIPSYPIHVLECSEFRIVILEESNEMSQNENEKNNLFTAILTAKRQEDEEGFAGFERVASHSYKFTIGKLMEIISLLDLIDAFIREYEVKNNKSLTQAISRSAFWRRSFTPSKKQLAILLKAAKKYEVTGKNCIFRITKGQAADAITRLNFLKTIKCPVQHAWSDILN